MKICDRCKEVTRYSTTQTYTFGLHQEGKPCVGTYASFEIDLCSNCRNDVINGYEILDCWKTLCKELKPKGQAEKDVK